MSLSSGPSGCLSTIEDGSEQSAGTGPRSAIITLTMSDGDGTLQGRLPPGPPLPRVAQTLGFIFGGPRFL